jgi:hypothetical protein
MELTQAKAAFRNWWNIMQVMSAKYGDPDEAGLDVEKTPEFDELANAHTRLLLELHNATGIDAFIFRKTVLMAMHNVLDDEDVQPSESQINEIMEQTVAFSAAAEAKVRQMQGELLN